MWDDTYLSVLLIILALFPGFVFKSGASSMAVGYQQGRKPSLFQELLLPISATLLTVVLPLLLYYLVAETLWGRQRPMWYDNIVEQQNIEPGLTSYILICLVLYSVFMFWGGKLAASKNYIGNPFSYFLLKDFRTQQFFLRSYWTNHRVLALPSYAFLAIFILWPELWKYLFPGYWAQIPGSKGLELELYQIIFWPLAALAFFWSLPTLLRIYLERIIGRFQVTRHGVLNDFFKSTEGPGAFRPGVIIMPKIGYYGSGQPDRMPKIRPIYLGLVDDLFIRADGSIAYLYLAKSIKLLSRDQPGVLNNSLLKLPPESHLSKRRVGDSSLYFPGDNIDDFLFESASAYLNIDARTATGDLVFFMKLWRRFLGILDFLFPFMGLFKRIWMGLSKMWKLQTKDSAKQHDKAETERRILIGLGHKDATKLIQSIFLLYFRNEIDFSRAEVIRQELLNWDSKKQRGLILHNLPRNQRITLGQVFFQAVAHPDNTIKNTLLDQLDLYEELTAENPDRENPDPEAANRDLPGAES